ncbi:DUF6498-containing protein [Haloarcula marismortui]|uniref:Uncharacterized protein n=2 Tax=Haloarcula marismortui ATCC 33800 TaxID=662476 RepID=M0JTG8_9EURY|nr:DUF6498-containing protein [Haloarcula sinaiiensis]EMA11264.1 hypothetical protein C436_15970 [Haloarcula sinaiiensis ATCC 33800]
MTQRLPTSVRGLSLVVANCIPLVGVTVWGWDLWLLLVVYTAEAACSVLIAATKALFAEQGSPGRPGQYEPLHELREKRGGFQIYSNWPPIYPRNIPFALMVLGVWFGFIGPISLVYLLTIGPTIQISVGLAVSVVALFFSQIEEFVIEYIGTSEYRDVSAQELIRTPAQLTLVLLFIGFLTLGGSRAGRITLLTGLVVGKTLSSLYRFYVDHIGGPLLDVDLKLSDDLPRSEPPPELTMPEEPVEASVAVNKKSVILGSLSAVGFALISRFTIITVAAFVIALQVGNPVWIGLLSIVVLCIVGARMLSFYLRYGTIEYQRRGKFLVAYDRLLESPQWIATIGPGTEYSVINAIVDRLRGTGRLRVASVDSVDRGSVQLGPLSDLDRAIETLDLPVYQTDRPERDPTIIAAAGGLLLLFLAVPAGLFLAPGVDSGTAYASLVVIGPFALIHTGILLYVALSRI